MFARLSYRPAKSTLAAFALALSISCSVAEPTANAKTAVPVNANAVAGPASETSAPKGPTIAIDKGGPADTVRAFYQLLREKKFRDAIFLTNLRPAIEGLTETQLGEFSLDFEALAGQVPPQMEINGEIVSGDKATVTIKAPAENGAPSDTQQIKLKKNGDAWMILTVDEEAEGRIKKEGKSYFYNLRVETHEEEARKMLERIAKAEIAYSLQHEGVAAGLDELIGAGLLPDDVKTSESTGYNYSLEVLPGKGHYFANATPAVYGKSGKLSFLLEPDAKGYAHVSNKDAGGKPMRQ
jgi:hypothetical protein